MTKMTVSIELVEETLRTIGVKFESPLRLLLRSSNWVISDRKHIVCKISPTKIGGKRLKTEIDFCLAYSQFVKTIPLKFNQVVTIIEGDTEYSVTCWEWVEIYNLSSLIQETYHLDQAVNDLEHIHKLPAGLEIGFDRIDPNSHLQTLNERVQYSRTKGVDEDSLYLMEKMINEFYATADVLFQNKRLVVSHGDTHLGNVVIDVEEPYEQYWIDYESVRVAPPEWDYAMLLNSLRRDKENPTFAPYLENLYKTQLGLNMDTVDKMEKMRTVSLLSFIMIQEDKRAFYNVLNHAKPLITGETKYLRDLPQW